MKGSTLLTLSFSILPSLVYGQGRDGGHRGDGSIMPLESLTQYADVDRLAKGFILDSQGGDAEKHHYGEDTLNAFVNVVHEVETASFQIPDDHFPEPLLPALCSELKENYPLATKEPITAMNTLLEKAFACHPDILKLAFEFQHATEQNLAAWEDLDARLHDLCHQQSAPLAILDQQFDLISHTAHELRNAYAAPRLYCQLH